MQQLLSFLFSLFIYNVRGYFSWLISLQIKKNKNFYLDNSKISELENKIIKKELKFDIIIEDAGHYFKDQIISLFILFKSLTSNGIFVVEELEFPNIRDDMNIYNEKPTLKDILKLINENKDFESNYITKSQKKYFLDNLKNWNI